MYSVLVLSVLDCISGRRLNSFKFSCTLFGIIPVLHSTSYISRFQLLFIMSSSCKSVYFWSLSVIRIIIIIIIIIIIAKFLFSVCFAQS